MEWEVFNDIRVDSQVNGHPLNNSGTFFYDDSDDDNGHNIAFK